MAIQPSRTQDLQHFINWEADDIRIRPLNLFHECSADPLYGIGSGFIERLSRSEIGLNLLVGQ